MMPYGKAGISARLFILFSPAHTACEAPICLLAPSPVAHPRTSVSSHRSQMDAMDVLESVARAPEGLGTAVGSSDGAQMIRYVNPAQCVTLLERKIVTRGVLILQTHDTPFSAQRNRALYRYAAICQRRLVRAAEREAVKDVAPLRKTRVRLPGSPHVP